MKLHILIQVGDKAAHILHELIPKLRRRVQHSDFFTAGVKLFQDQRVQAAGMIAMHMCQQYIVNFPQQVFFLYSGIIRVAAIHQNVPAPGPKKDGCVSKVIGPHISGPKKTDILIIDDARKGFDFDTFYTMITGSITVNPKNEKSFELKYEDAPNIVFTSNYPIPNNDSSTMARILFVAFSDYYHIASPDNGYKEDRKVNHEVGDLFDADYKEEEYNADINFFIDCLQFYLCCQAKNWPAINPPMESIQKRILHDKMGKPFLAWAREFFDRSGRFIDNPFIRQAAYQDYCNSIERNAEKKGKNGWLESIRAYIEYCDDLECLNPDGLSKKQKDGRLMYNMLWNGVSKTWECLYIKSKNSDTLSDNVQYP